MYVLIMPSRQRWRVRRIIGVQYAYCMRNRRFALYAMRIIGVIPGFAGLNTHIVRIADVLCKQA